MSLASGTTDVVSAAITALGVVLGAGLAMWGVIYTARMQKRPKIVDVDAKALHQDLVAERERRIQAEAERDAWRQMALALQRGLPD